MVRVLGEDETAQNVQINSPFQVQTQEGISDKIYDLTAGRYDVTVKAGPSFTTQREESATQMMELLRAFPAAAPYVGDILARNLDWPGADEIAKRLEAMLPPQLQGDQGGDPEKQALVAQVQQLVGQLEAMARGHDIKIQELQIKLQEAGIKRQEAGTKQFEADTNRFEAETDRLEAGMEAAQSAPIPMVPGRF